MEVTDKKTEVLLGQIYDMTMQWIHRNLIFGNSRMRKVIGDVLKLSGGDSNVSILITGEKGVGKTLISRLVHLATPTRGTGRFVDVHQERRFVYPSGEKEIERVLCGKEGIGGLTNEPGVFAQAKVGSIFFDNLHLMPMVFQEHLLQILAVKEYTDPGSFEKIRIDVRVISATNQDPRQMTQTGKLNEVLYKELNGFHITLPPLRERTEDIIPLAEHFVSGYNREYGRDLQIQAADKNCLEKMPWGENVSQLQHYIYQSYTTTSPNESFVRFEYAVISGQPEKPAEKGQKKKWTDFTEEEKKGIILKIKEDIKKGIKQYVLLKEYGLSKTTYNSHLKQLEAKDGKKDQSSDSGQNRPPAEPNRPTA